MSETSDAWTLPDPDLPSIQQAAQVSRAHAELFSLPNHAFLTLLAEELRRRSDPDVEPRDHAEGNVYVLFDEDFGQHIDVTIEDHYEV